MSFPLTIFVCTCTIASEFDGTVLDTCLTICSTTAESLTNHNEAELQRRCQERQEEIDHMQQVLETKIQLLQEVGLLIHTCIDTHKYPSLAIHNYFFVCFAGGPASTQWGWEDGLTGWITLPRFPSFFRHRHGGDPRRREAPKHPVSIQHQQRQVQNAKIITNIKLNENVFVCVTDCACIQVNRGADQGALHEGGPHHRAAWREDISDSEGGRAGGSGSRAVLHSATEGQGCRGRYVALRLISHSYRYKFRNPPVNVLYKLYIKSLGQSSITLC